MKILVAEDDFTSRKIVRTILEPFGDCDFAVDGVEALDAFRAASKDGEPYQLICLDINMPKLSGLEVLKQIREIEEGCGVGGLDGVKVIMTTGSGDKKSILGAFKAGCEAYIVKPIDREKLLGLVAELGIAKS